MRFYHWAMCAAENHNWVNNYQHLCYFSGMGIVLVCVGVWPFIFQILQHSDSFGKGSWMVFRCGITKKKNQLVNKKEKSNISSIKKLSFFFHLLPIFEKKNCNSQYLMQNTSIHQGLYTHTLVMSCGHGYVGWSWKVWVS